MSPRARREAPPLPPARAALLAGALLGCISLERPQSLGDPTVDAAVGDPPAEAGGPHAPSPDLPKLDALPPDLGPGLDVLAGDLASDLSVAPDARDVPAALDVRDVPDALDAPTRSTSATCPMRPMSSMRPTPQTRPTRPRPPTSRAPRARRAAAARASRSGAAARGRRAAT